MRTKIIGYLIFIILSVALIVSALKCTSQTLDVYMGCPLGGKIANYDDSMKNRYAIPFAYTTISFTALSNLKVTAAMPAKTVTVVGYCLLVKDGGAETCNCKTKDRTQWDTHIELTIDNKHIYNKDAIVCEVNSRIRYTLSQQGIDFTTKTLKKLMVGHMVQISGYAFYDDHHKQNSVADSPNGTDNWRSTTFEIHPVTSIKILN